MTREILEESGYHVLSASRAQDALELSQRHAGPIHLLLTDARCPARAGPGWPSAWPAIGRA